MISLNIFSKCPYNGNPKTRLKGLLNKEERSFITLHMLTNILDEVSEINDDFKNVNGKYFFKLKEKKTSKESYNKELANQIWIKSLEYLKL